MNQINYETEFRREWCQVNSTSSPCFLFARKFSRPAAMRQLSEGIVAPYDASSLLEQISWSCQCHVLSWDYQKDLGSQLFGYQTYNTKVIQIWRNRIHSRDSRCHDTKSLTTVPFRLNRWAKLVSRVPEMSYTPTGYNIYRFCCLS